VWMWDALVPLLHVVWPSLVNPVGRRRPSEAKERHREMRLAEMKKARAAQSPSRGSGGAGSTGGGGDGGGGGSSVSATPPPTSKKNRRRSRLSAANAISSDDDSSSDSDEPRQFKRLKSKSPAKQATPKMQPPSPKDAARKAGVIEVSSESD
jgi:hypothetical protein